MNIAIGSDHAGFAMKAHVMKTVGALGHTVREFGSFNPDPVDFPDVTREICQAILGNEVERAIIVCGTGIGAAIAANKIPGIRAAVCHDVHSAHQCVEHNDVNVLCLGAQIVGPWLAVDLLKAFLEASFSTDPDCRRRVAKISDIERSFSH